MEKEIVATTKDEIRELDVQLEEEIEDVIMSQIEKGKREINAFFELQELHVKRQTSKLASRCLFNMKKTILNHMIDHVVDVKYKAEKRLNKCDQEDFKDIYLKILTSLLLQGLFILSEKRVTLKVREEDVLPIQSNLKAVVQACRRITKKPLQLKLDTKSFILDAGVSLETGNVSLINTLKARLDRILSANIPTIKLNLFGPMSNYKSRPIKLAL